VRAPQSVFKEALIVARYELISMVLSVRAVMFVVLYGMASGIVGRLYLWADEQIGITASYEKGMSALTDADRQAMIQKAVDSGFPRAVAEAMLEGNLPPLVFAVLFFSTFVIPALIVLTGYTAIADDLNTRFARYVLQRVRRGSFLAGKIAAHFLVSFAAVLVVHLILLVAAQAIDNFDNEKTMQALPRIWLAMAVFTLAYSAFTATFSTLLRPPFLAFAISLMALVFLWVLSKFSPFDRVWMGALDLDLWALSPQAFAIYGAHILVFSGLAWLAMNKRDV
jgi:hypothetical protein